MKNGRNLKLENNLTYSGTYSSYFVAIFYFPIDTTNPHNITMLFFLLEGSCSIKVLNEVRM